MSGEAVIRPGVADDLPGLLALYIQLHPQDPALDLANARAIWDRMMTTAGLAVLVAVLPCGRVVATATVMVMPNLSRGGRPHAMIEDVVSDTAHRGQGHGRRVVQAAIQAARQAGCHKVALATGRGDVAVHRFYEAAGLTAGGKTYFEARWP